MATSCRRKTRNADGDPATSDGIFVFNTAVPVAVGDKVRVRGTVAEFVSSGGSLTELAPVTAAQTCSVGEHAAGRGRGRTARAVGRDLGAATKACAFTHSSVADRERDLHAGALRRAGALLRRPAARSPRTWSRPAHAAIARQALNDRNRIVLDDGNNQQNHRSDPLSQRRA